VVPVGFDRKIIAFKILTINICCMSQQIAPHFWGPQIGSENSSKLITILNVYGKIKNSCYLKKIG